MRLDFASALLFSVSSLSVVACSPTGNVGAGTPDMNGGFVTTDPLILARPYEGRAPAGYDGSKALPLIVSLHGYQGTPFLQDAFFGLGAVENDKQFLYAMPAATKDKGGSFRWAVDGNPAGIDDVAYLDAVIRDMSARYRVDPKRVYMTGHSNGSAMTFRYACDRAGTVAAVVPVSGTYSTDPTVCNPSMPVAVLHVIGDQDPAYPGNPTSQAHVAYWATRDGCNPMPDTSSPPLDLDTSIPGDETAVTRYKDCAGGAAEFWLIQGAPHVPHFGQPKFPDSIIDWMYAHARN